MKFYKFTALFVLKTTSVLCVLMFLTVAYSHWTSVRGEGGKNSAKLIHIAEFIQSVLPPDLVLAAADGGALPDDAYSGWLQEALNTIYIPDSNIKYGIFSQRLNRIVALGPNADNSLLSSRYDERAEALHATDAAQMVKEEHSFVWYGASAWTYSLPLVENEQIVGYVFASLNQDQINTTLFYRTLNTFVGAVVICLLCICISVDVLLQLKSDLASYVESLAAGTAAACRSKVPGLTPLLNYIVEQSQRIKKLDRLDIISAIASGVAHEIRNPMTTVRGLLQFLGLKKNTADYHEDFALMISEIDNANKIITDLMYLSKDKIMTFKSADLNAIIQEIARQLQSDAAFARIAVQLNLQELPLLPLDQTSIRLLLLNFIKNAADAMPDGGVIWLRTERTADDVAFFIKDNGPGISPEIKDKLGTPFFTTKDMGTGLGLAMCYRIAERHAATLTINSAPGQGAEFIVRFPLNPAQTAPRPINAL